MVASKTSPPIAPGVVGPLPKASEDTRTSTSRIPHDTTKAASSKPWRGLLSPRSSRRFHSLAYSASQHSFEKAISVPLLSLLPYYIVYSIPNNTRFPTSFGLLNNGPSLVWKNRVRSSTVTLSCHLLLFDSLYRYITATEFSCRLL